MRDVAQPKSRVIAAFGPPDAHVRVRSPVHPRPLKKMSCALVWTGSLDSAIWICELRLRRSLPRMHGVAPGAPRQGAAPRQAPTRTLVVPTAA